MGKSVLPEGQIYIGFWEADNRTKEEADKILSSITKILVNLDYDVLVRREEYGYVVEYNETFNRAQENGSNRFDTISDEEADVLYNMRYGDTKNEKEEEE